MGIVKLKPAQYDFLKQTLGKERADLFKHLLHGDGHALEIDDAIVTEIRDWVSQRLQVKGFDENYNLTPEGRMLEELEDRLYG